MEQEEAAVGEQSSLLHAEESFAEPILVCDVIPVASDTTGNEEEEHQQLAEQDELIRLDEVRLRVRDEGIEPLRKAKT